MGTAELSEMASTTSAAGVNMDRVFLTVARLRSGSASSVVGSMNGPGATRFRTGNLASSFDSLSKDIRAIADAAAIGDLH